MSRARLTHLLEAVWVPLALSVLVVLAAVLGGVLGGAAFEARMDVTLVYLVIVIGIYVFIGNSGVASFGHISFTAIGAYTFALMTVPVIRKSVLLPDLPNWIGELELHALPASIIAALLACAFAAIIGWPLMRLSGIPAAIALFSVLIVVNVVISQSYSITRGAQTMTGIPVTATRNTLLAWVVVSLFIAAAYQATRSGLRLRCSREDEFGAQAIGISITRERMIGLIASAFVCGIGGALYGALQGSLSPQAFYVQATFTTIVMLVVGGMRSLTGAVVGTITVFGVQEVLRRAEEGFDVAGQHVPSRPGLQLVGVSLLGLLIVLFRPRGITGGREIPAPHRLRSRRVRSGGTSGGAEVAG